MAMQKSDLGELPPDKIKRNADNPRLIFREDQERQLLESIREVGIKVPISVYADGSKYVLIDGERRWRCARKLNLTSMPALIQPKPSRLENILMMFNIHNVRVEWDLMPMALKLGQVVEMLQRQRKSTSPKDLAGITGLSVPTVKRALELLELPQKYQRMLIEEAKKPRGEQLIKADLFVEINKSYSAVTKYQPEVATDFPKARYRDAMVQRYKGGKIQSVTDFRLISKIARAEKAGESKAGARKVLRKFMGDPDYSAQKAYQSSVETAYRSRDLHTRSMSLARSLKSITSNKGLSKQLAESLRLLQQEIKRLIGD